MPMVIKCDGCWNTQDRAVEEFTVMLLTSLCDSPNIKQESYYFCNKCLTGTKTFYLDNANYVKPTPKVELEATEPKTE